MSSELETPQVQILVWPEPNLTEQTDAPDVTNTEVWTEPAAEWDHHRGDGGGDLPQTQTQAPMIPHTSQASGGGLLPEVRRGLTAFPP